MTLRATQSSFPPSARRGSDRLAELARRRALDADAMRPGVTIPAILAVLAVAAIHWWLFTGGTWTGHPMLTIDFSNQADALLHYANSPGPNAQPLLHGSGAAILLVPFQYALHRGILDQPISDQCVLLIFAWGVTALIARWLCRLHAHAPLDSPVSFIVAGTLIGSLLAPWPSLLLHPDPTATAIAVATFFFISGLYILWSNRCAPISHLIPLLLTGGCWLLAVLASPILLPTVVLTALLTSPFALPRRKFALVAFITMLLPLAVLACPATHPGRLANWRALAVADLFPNFRHLLAMPLSANWLAIFKTVPHLRTGEDFDPSILLWQSPLFVALLFGAWGLLRTRPKKTLAIEPAPSDSQSNELATPGDENAIHDPDRIVIRPRAPKGAPLSYTLAIDAGLPPEQPATASRIAPRRFHPAGPPDAAARRISPPRPLPPQSAPASDVPAIGLIWLAVSLLGAVICTTLCAMLLPAPSARLFALTTHAAALLLILTWWQFVARHKTRPAFRLAMVIALVLGLLTLCASYLSIALIPA